MKITKQEWLDFCNEENDCKFWDTYYMDEVIITTNDGTEIEDDESEEFNNLPNNAKISVEGGLYDHYSGNYFRSLDTQIKLWRKQRTHTTLIVSVKKDDLEKLKLAINLAGGKIIP